MLKERKTPQFLKLRKRPVRSQVTTKCSLQNTFLSAWTKISRQLSMRLACKFHTMTVSWYRSVKLIFIRIGSTDFFSTSAVFLIFGVFLAWKGVSRKLSMRFANCCYKFQAWTLRTHWSYRFWIRLDQFFENDVSSPQLKKRALSSRLFSRPRRGIRCFFNARWSYNLSRSENCAAINTVGCAHDQRAEIPPKLTPQLQDVTAHRNVSCTLRCAPVSLTTASADMRNSFELTLNLSGERLCLSSEILSIFDRNRPETRWHRPMTIKGNFHALAFSIWSSLEMTEGPNYPSVLVADSWKLWVGRLDAIGL